MSVTSHIADRRRIVAAAVVASLALAGCAAGNGAGGAAAPDVPTPRVDRFDADRAMADVRMQVDMGERPAGSAASRRLAARLRARLPRGAFETVPGRPAGMRNVVGHLPGRRPALLVGAHYDTKAIPGFVGANDGAAGTAVVLELARVLRTGRRACQREIRFVLFDGEESPDDSREFLRSGVRGSRAYAARHAGDLAAVVVVDFVGNHGLRLPRERGSHAGLWARMRASAQRVGVGQVFPARTVPEVYDDHTPFARAGVPSIDLIDFTYPHFHLVSDDLSQISPASLDATGEALVDLLRREAARTCR